MAALVATAPAGAAAGAQERQGVPPPDDVVTLPSQLVNIDVLVTDSKGRFVTDLKPGDLRVVEDGAPQQVVFFDPPTSAAPAAAAGANAPRALVSLVLDSINTDPGQMKRVGDGATAYLRGRAPGAEAVAVFRVASGLQLLQNFTRDQARLLAAVERGYTTGSVSATGEVQEVSDVLAEPRLAENMLRLYTALRTSLAYRESRPVVSALAAIADAQRGVTGKKIVVLFTEGFDVAQTQDWQVQAMIDVANRANVAVYVIESGGLATNPFSTGGFGGSAGAGGFGLNALRPMDAVGGETVFDRILTNSPRHQHDVLYRLAQATGGEFIKNTNDFEAGLRRVDEQVRARYTLGYQTTNAALDGKFRRVRVEATRPGLRVAARAGYFAVKPGAAAPLSENDTKLLADFDEAAARPDMPLFAELSAFRGAQGRYVVPVSLEVPPSAVTFESTRGGHRLDVQVLGVVRDAAGEVAARLGGDFDVELTDAQLKAVAGNTVFYRQDVELQPGSYTVDLIVRDRPTGRTAARREALELPEAGAGLSMSGVVLSRTVMPAAAGEAADVLSARGARIRPSASRAFAPGDKLIVYFNVYNAAPVDATLTLTRGSKVVKRIGYRLTEESRVPVPHLAFAKFVELTGFAAGEYTARVEARDAAAGLAVDRDVRFTVAN